MLIKLTASNVSASITNEAGESVLSLDYEKFDFSLDIMSALRGAEAILAQLREVEKKAKPEASEHDPMFDLMMGSLLATLLNKEPKVTTAPETDLGPSEGKPESDEDWQRWAGSADNTPPAGTAGKHVDVKLRNGQITIARRTDSLGWIHTDGGFDIVAWRPAV